MRTRVSFLVTTAFALFAAPTIASAAGPRNLVDLANMFAKMLNSGATFLVLAGLVIYFGGVTIGLFKQSQGGKSDLRKILFWGIVVIFVMVSIWGILQLLQNTLFGNNSGSQGSGASPGTDLQFTNAPLNQ